MSEYTVTNIAIAKINLENTKLAEVYKYMNVTDELLEEDELEIHVDPYEDKKDKDGNLLGWEFSTKYLLMELIECPQNVIDMENIINTFKKYEKYLVPNTFEIKSILWYNGADMPLYNL